MKRLRGKYTKGIVRRLRSVRDTSETERLRRHAIEELEFYAPLWLRWNRKWRRQWALKS